MKKIISIGSDHAGFELKKFLINHLLERNFELIDHGTNNSESVDYPDIVKPVVTAILNKKSDIAILICGSGIGMSIATNRYESIRGALCYNIEAAKLARAHNDANILILGSRMMDENTVLECLEIFLNTDFEAGKHLVRINKIENL